MIRFCPNCQSERSLSEIFCEGSIQGQPCGWDLSAEAIHPAGWRPQPVLTQEAIAPPASEPPAASAPLCANGHPLQPGDLMCLECGAAPAEGPLPMQAEATPQPAVTETLIDGWRLLRQIASSDGLRERYLAEHAEGARQAVLTLYRPGAEPDPAIYDVIRRLPREHVPEILATGRWDERAYEVVEELTGGSLADLGTVLEDREAVRHVVRELGHALHVFNEAGLRHRDLRPASLLVRSHEPLDLVISGFGSARLSEFDLDIVSPLETSRYMAPEAIAGGVAAASDWWSLGMILLEQLTRGSCFEGVNANAFLIHVLANGVALPDDLDPQLHLLLRGLLARDRHQRWQWPQVQAWLNGEAVDAPASADSEKDDAEGASIALGARRFRKPTVFALAAAQAEHWAEALDHLLRGAIVTWAEHIGLSPRLLAGLRQVAQHEGLEDDFRLMLALKLLNPEIPLIQRGEIVTPGWLLEHPLEGYRLISGSVPDLLEQLHTESWLSRLKTRAENVRQRALHQHIELAEEQLRIYLLSTSRARLAAQWQERQRLLPDTEHPGLLALAERRVIAEEDLIVLLSANIGQFRAAEAIVEEAAGLARDADVHLFDAETARGLLQHSRQELYRRVDERISGFARSGVPRVDEWAEQFRLERRMPLARVLVLLAIPPEQWLEPQKQQYVSQILDFFEKKVVAAVMRGPLVRMSIGKSTPRIDLNELHSARRPAAALLDHLLQRNARAVSLDPDSFLANPQLEVRLNALSRQSSLYKRDTGIDGLYLGFPFLLNRDPRGTTRTRIVPLLLWPLKLQLEVGSRGQVALAFDGEREEVRLNPALESLLGPEPCKRWRKVADELLGRSALRAADVMDAFGLLATPRARVLEGLPPSSTEVTPYQDQLACAAVLFHVTFMGQAIGEDLRQLKSLPPSGTGLETALRLRENGEPEARESPPELQRYFTVASDPSQEAAVLQARQSPGLLVEGPPGTGKSQTIVNMVADAIGRQRSLLIVCQKHAALEVVHKRLVAEGLGQRIVMLNDVNRDREPVIRNIREQLEALFADAGGAQGWERQRERLAARIEALEGELDRYHQSLHRVDEATGLSYRRLLGELIELEKGSPPLDFPALRQRLAALDIGSLARLEENCAPLVRLWLPARYEGSPLAQLRAFATDQATLQAFADSLRAFGEAENARQKALDEHPASFEVDDPTPYRAWLASQVGTLLNLREEQRQRLAHWLPLFRDATPGQPSRGDGLLAEAEQIERQLRQLDLERHAPLLSPALAMLEENNLERFQAHARQVLEARTWLARLNPLRLLRRGRLRRFLREHGEADDDSRLAALLGACDLERQWRPLRRQLAALQQSLGLATVATDAGPELTGLAGHASQQLREIQVLARGLAQAPRAEQLDAVILTGEKQRFEALLGDLDAALIRQAARQLSLDKLKVLADWLGDELLEQLHRAIAGNQSNLPALGRLREALPQLVAYQRFRGRAGQLEATELEFLALLRQRQERLDAIPAEALEATVRRMLNREARLGWKQRLEQDNPELLFSQDEARARVASLAEADVQMRALNRELLGKGIDAARLGSRKQYPPDRQALAAPARVHRAGRRTRPDEPAPGLADEPRPGQPRAAAQGRAVRHGDLRRSLADAGGVRPADPLSRAGHGGQRRREADAADRVLLQPRGKRRGRTVRRRSARRGRRRGAARSLRGHLEPPRDQGLPGPPATGAQRPAQHHPADPLPLGLPRADRLLQRLVLRQPPERAGTPSAGQHPAHQAAGTDPGERPVPEPEQRARGRASRRLPRRTLAPTLRGAAVGGRGHLQPQAGRPHRGAPGTARRAGRGVPRRLQRGARAQRRRRGHGRVREERGERAGRRARRDRLLLHLRPQRPGQLPAQLRRARADRRRAPPQRGGDPRAAQGGDDHLDADRRHLRHARHPALAEQPARLPARLPGIRPRTVRRRIRRHRPAARAPAHRPQRPAPPALPAARWLQRDRRRVYPLAGLVRRARQRRRRLRPRLRHREPGHRPLRHRHRMRRPLPPAAGTRPRPGNLAPLGAAAGDPVPPPGFLPGLVPRRRQRTRTAARRHREGPGAQRGNPSHGSSGGLPMSGPKVVRIVTREEAIATCERDLQRLDKALARWENQASRLAQLSDAERAAAHARRASLHALLEQERWLDVQLQVKIESEFLKRDLAEREERAIRQAAESRQQHRRLQENASALFQALDARPDAASATLRQTLQALADGALRDDAEALLAQGFAALASAPAEERLSAAQHELAQRLKTDETPITLEQWRARQQQDAPHEQRLARIDRHIAELQLLQGEASAQAFLERLARAEAEQRPERRNLLLDSLVLDLAQAAREHQQQRQRLEHLQDLASEVAALGAAEHAELLQRAAACQPDSDPQQLAELTERCNAILTAHLQQQAALARRQAVLQGLASLGYEVREGMATAWAQTGRVVLRKPATPGYGLEVGGKADNGRLQLRAVALNANRDSQRDRDIETLWCGEFQRLQALLAAQGGELSVERALGVGEVALKEIGEEEQREMGVVRQRGL